MLLFRVTLAFATVLTLMLAPSSRPALAAISQLRVVPNEGHASNLIDLSGSGFPPSTPLNIVMACPNWQNGDAINEGNVVLMHGPKTDGHGEFTGFLFHAIHLHGLTTSSCQINAAFGDNPFAVDVPAVYFIRQSGQPLQLSPCQKHLCVRVHVRSKQVRPGYHEKITLKTTWPGANVTAFISYPGRTVKVGPRRTNWTGTLAWTEQAPADGPRPETVKVTATAALGGMSSSDTAGFTIVR